MDWLVSFPGQAKSRALWWAFKRKKNIFDNWCLMCFPDDKPSNPLSTPTPTLGSSSVTRIHLSAAHINTDTLWWVWTAETGRDTCGVQVPGASAPFQLHYWLKIKGRGSGGRLKRKEILNRVERAREQQTGQHDSPSYKFYLYWDNLERALAPLKCLKIGQIGFSDVSFLITCRLNATNLQQCHSIKCLKCLNHKNIPEPSQLFTSLTITSKANHCHQNLL